MKLQLSTWQEVETYLKTQNGIVIPIGSTEQHGPNGLIGTDALTAEAVAWGVGDSCNCYVAPTIAVGMALHHLEFPGSMSLSPSTLIKVISESIVSLARHGFKVFYFINGHGGNIATTQAAFSEAYWLLESHWGIKDIRCHLSSWFLQPEVCEWVSEKFGDNEGFHATPSEVAVTQHLFPDHIKSGSQLNPVPKVELPRVYSAAQFRESYHDGRMGSDPSLASPELGKKILEIAVQAETDSFRHFYSESRM